MPLTQDQQSIVQLSRVRIKSNQNTSCVIGGQSELCELVAIAIVAIESIEKIAGGVTEIGRQCLRELVAVRP